MSSDPGAHLAKELVRAIRACQAEHWREGMELLTQVARLAEGKVSLPSRYHSYLGLALLRCQGRKHDGLELCRHAVRAEPDEPDNYANLAWAYLIVGRRAAAVRALGRGLALMPEHSRLLEAQAGLGLRRPPALSFLGRKSPFNVLLGRFSAWREERQKQRLEDLEDEEL